MMSTSNSSSNEKVDGASKSSECEVNDMLQNMSTTDKDEDIASVCANCGEEGSSDNMNTCNKCKKAKYCNAACKKKHRHKHKKECEEHVRLAAEHAAKYDEKLFKKPPLAEDCPICFLRMPTLHATGSRYMTCCGKIVCSGCAHASVYDNQGNKVDGEKCAFCRVPKPISTEEATEREQIRVKANDAQAVNNLGVYYRDGTNGYTQDYRKALELFHRSAELGYIKGAYCCIGALYYNGEGVEVDKKKAGHYYEVAAMMGDATARHNLGNNEVRAGSMDRAIRHYMIAVRDGYTDSLKTIKQLYTHGHATKEDYTKALRSYQTYLEEIKSVQRDKAAVFSDSRRYYESGV